MSKPNFRNYFLGRLRVGHGLVPNPQVLRFLWLGTIRSRGDRRLHTARSRFSSCILVTRSLPAALAVRSMPGPDAAPLPATRRPAAAAASARSVPAPRSPVVPPPLERRSFIAKHHPAAVARAPSEALAQGVVSHQSARRAAPGPFEKETRGAAVVQSGRRGRPAAKPHPFIGALLPR